MRCFGFRMVLAALPLAVLVSACAAPHQEASRREAGTARVIVDPAMRSSIHETIVVGDEVRTAYYPGQVSEPQIVDALRPFCRARGRDAVRADAETRHQTDRAADGMPLLVSLFSVLCVRPQG